MAEANDPVLDLIEVLHRLRLSDIEGMDDTALRAVSALLMNWQELITQEIDGRALGTRQRRIRP